MLKNCEKILLTAGFLALLAFALVGCQATADSRRSADSNTSENLAQSSQLTVYFNDPLAGLPLMNKREAQANGLDKALTSLIDSASKTLDIAVYSITHSDIISALGQGCTRKVKIRIVTETRQARLQALPCVSLKLDQNEYSMHHKFIIADGKFVWTGSLNFSFDELYFNANNAVVIENAAVAKAYALEFEELFSGRFGQQKEDNNDEIFSLAGTKLEIYFSPSDFPEGVLLEKIKGAKSSIYIAMFFFTNDLIYQALVQAKARGVSVTAVWDLRGWENFSDSEIDEMLFLGVGIVDANPGLVHHKFAVIDEKTVITGSANWSFSGMNRNDENILIVHDAAIAKRFIEHFNKLYQDALKYDQDPTQPPRVTLKHHNTQDVLARIEWRSQLKTPVDFYEICRASTSMGPCEKTFSNLPNNFRYHVDTSAEQDKTYYYRMRSRMKNAFTSWSNEYITKAELASCPPDEECACNDGIDNDGDRYTDCRDRDCATATACLGPAWMTATDSKIITEVLSAKEVTANPKKYLGKLATVEFTVAETLQFEKTILLESSPERKDFNTVIKENHKAFQRASIPPASAYFAKVIRVSGLIEEYKGSPQIKARGPWQIEVMGRPQIPTITAKEAEANLKKYLGQLVTVKFKVVEATEREKVIFLNSSKDYQTDFTAVIFKPDDAKNFKEAGIDPVSFYVGKTVEVTGVLREYNGPEIILRGPWQITVSK